MMTDPSHYRNWNCYELVDFQIENHIECNEIQITPYNKDLVNPNSIDIRLGYDFIKYESTGYPIDPYEPIPKNRTTKICLKNNEHIFITRDDFILGTTLEKITLPRNIRARLEGKSSLARMGLVTHQTGGYIDAGFSGEITLELSSVFPDPVKLYPGMPIGQLVFTKTAPCNISYNEKSSSKYHEQKGATESLYHRNKK